MRQISPLARDDILVKKLPELVQLKALADAASGVARVNVESVVVAGDWEFPTLSFSFGSESDTAPVFIIVGGVHGLERIGTNLAAAFIKSLLEWCVWDSATKFIFERVKICVYPLVNPAGMFFKRRSNMNGVDLMRNAPIDALEEPNVRLVGGHRISRWIPWYRGPEGDKWEREAEELVKFVRASTATSPFTMILDLHSGFGVKDRIWFPYARSRQPFHWLGEVHALKVRLDRCLPNHVYLMEPQSKTYITHGDIWDFLALERESGQDGRPFLPMTLEMGSWMWVRKNPSQLFSALGLFNPVLPHRIQRTLRRHISLLEFMMRATASWESWADLTTHSESGHRDRAMRLWYPQVGI